MTTVSVVVPAYREPGLVEFHRRLVGELNFWWSWDLVYSVGDYETLAVALKLMDETNRHNVDRPRTVRVVMQDGRGLGMGVRTGLEAALLSKPEFVVTMEADGSNDPADIRRLVAECLLMPGLFFRGSVVASKRYDSRPFWKKSLSKIYRSALRLRYGLGFGYDGVGDYTHLFRCSRAKVVEAVLPHLRYKGYEGVAEFHVRAKQAGYPFMLSLLTDYRERTAGKSKLTARKMIAMARLLLS